MSVQRYYAQRNNNNTTVVPVRFPDKLSIGPITDATIYSLNIKQAEYVGGIYYVDLAGVDTDGNPLDLTGQLASFVGESETLIHIICFVVNIDTRPASYPGLKIPIYFKNIPYATLDIPLVTIGLLSPNIVEGGLEAPPLPFILSPPFPPLLDTNISPNVTFESDTENFDVVSSGPAGWLGLPALLSILSYYAAFTPT